MTQWERTEPNGKRRTTGILSTAEKDTGGSGEPGTIKELMSFFEEQQHLDLEVTHTGDAEHGNSGESATVSKKKKSYLLILKSCEAGTSSLATTGSLVLSQLDQQAAFQGGKVEQDLEMGFVRLSQE